MGAVTALVLGVLIGGIVQATDLRGTVVIEKKLTRRSVTARAGAYQRGMAVDLAQAATTDSLAFERSHVAVYVEAAPTNVAAPTLAAAAIKQNHREFEPDFVVVPVGSTVSFPNFDPIFHNVFSLSKAQSFDLGNYPMGETRRVTFLHPGIVFVNCHLHPNMAASVVVSPTPWCARAGRDGRFELKDLPPGKYTVVAWHKSAGFFRQTVEFGGGDAPEIRFLIPFTENDFGAVAGQ
jgi:plastocyanin